MSRNTSLSEQIVTISKVLMLGMLVLSVFAVAITLLIKATFVEYRATARTTLTANAVFEDIFEARLAALKWRLSPDQAQIDEVRGNMEELRAAEAEIASVTGSGSDLARSFDNLSADLNEYEAQFDTMLTARANFDALDGEIRDAGLAARKALTEIMLSAYEDGDPTASFHAARAQEALMLGRYYLERFRRTEASGDIDRSLAEMQKARLEMDTLLPELQNPKRRELAGTAIEQIAHFKKMKPALLDFANDEINARTVLDTIGPKIVADVEAVIDAATARQNTLGPRGQSVATWSVVVILLAAASIIWVGWAISRRLSARIASDVEESVQTMGKIADGQLDTEVANTDLENEIGRMARALEVFKSNGKAAIAAAEREKEAETERQRVQALAKEQREQEEEVARQRAEQERKEMIASLSKSLGTVVSAASEGDFSKRIDDDFADRELAALADDVNSLVQSVEFGIDATRKTLDSVANGELRNGMTGEFKGAFKDLQDNTNQMIQSLKQLISGISDSTDKLAHSSFELRDTSDDLSKGAEENAAALAETSASLQHLSQNIKQVDANIANANENAQITSSTAKQGRAVASEAAKAMNRINEASAEISKVVGVINDISFQINLLALNAGVEAARAGEAGRGFSVVASEVRQLAQRASDASQEIANVIEQSDAAVADGVQKVSEAEQSLQQIANRVVEVSAGISDVAHAVSEQVNGIAEISAAVTQVDQNTQNQVASFEEVTAAGGVLSDEASALQSATGNFKTGVEKPKGVGGTDRAKFEVHTSPGARPVNNLAEKLEPEDWQEF